MAHLLRRGAVVFGLFLALAPISAFADNAGNQAAIDAAKARTAWLQNMTPMQEGVALGQAEIANATAIAKLLNWDGHAQTEVPNSMQQYAMFCDMAIAHVNAQVANANAMAMARPWDLHAQAEQANANALSRALWSIIGTTYGGNPYLTTPYAPEVADDAAYVASDEDAVAASDDAMVASDADVAPDAVADDPVDAVDATND